MTTPTFPKATSTPNASAPIAEHDASLSATPPSMRRAKHWKREQPGLRVLVASVLVSAMLLAAVAYGMTWASAAAA